MNRLLLALLLLSAVPVRGARLELTPCRLPEIEGEALRCGTYEVFEDRAAGKGRRAASKERKIALRVVVVPARETPVEPDPVIYFEGGPGVSIVQSGPDVVAELAAVLRHRDILLIDVRGTGGSHRLDCPRPDGGQAMPAIAQTLDTFMDPAALRRCRETLEKENDLSQYTTDSIVDDVDEVRAALGYPRVNVMGASYGTRAALVYLRRHPESVRTVMISSVLPVDARVPTHLAKHTQAGFDRLAADCAAEPACHAAFPDPKGDLDAVLKRLAGGPVEVAVQDDDGKPQRLRLSRNGAAQTVRYLLYRPAGIRMLPLFLHRAAAGDLGPLGQAAWDIASAMRSASSQGLYLSVTCAEDVAFVDRAEAAKLSEGTFFGDFRLRQQIEACEGWPAAKLPASFLEPVRSKVPVLILAGENDPATPVEWARKVSETLPGSRLLVVPGGSHVFYNLEGIECLDRLTAELVERGSAEGLDLEGCRRSIRRPPFATSLDGL